MRSIPSAIQTLLASGKMILRANLYVFVLPVGTVYLTDAEQDLSVADTYGIWSGTKTFSHAGQVVRRSRSKVSSDASVDDAEIVFEGAGLTTLGNNLGVPLSALAGQFDKARCCVLKCFFDPTAYGNTSNGTVLDLDGYCYPADISSSALRLQVKSHLALTMVPVPARLVQPSCPFRFGDSFCGATVPSNAVTIAAGSTARVLNVSATPASANSIGWVTFTSGVNKGLSRRIASITGTTVTLITSFPAAPSTGDAATVYAGCDKTRANCINKPNFGGCPDAPGPLTMSTKRV